MYRLYTPNSWNSQSFGNGSIKILFLFYLTNFFTNIKNLVSGGVDSSVCAALLRKALNPDQVIAIHIDNGFMRKNESSLVEESLKKVGIDLKCLFIHLI